MVKDKSGFTALEKSLIDNDIQITSNLLNLLIKGDKKGLLYSQNIAPNLFKLNKMGIDLKLFFSSTIAFVKVDENNSNFDQLHSNSNYKIVSSNEDLLKNILNKKSNLFDDFNNKKEETQFKIEYNVVNMKELIGINEKFKVNEIIELIDELSDFDLTYLEIDVLQVIINFKWQNYTK